MSLTAFDSLRGQQKQKIRNQRVRQKKQERYALSAKNHRPDRTRNRNAEIKGTLG